MTLFDLLILLIVAGICGALGQAITGFSSGERGTVCDLMSHQRPGTATGHRRGTARRAAREAADAARHPRVPGEPGRTAGPADRGELGRRRLAGHREDTAVARVPAAPRTGAGGRPRLVRAADRHGRRRLPVAGGPVGDRRQAVRGAARDGALGRHGGTGTVAGLQQAVALWRGPGVADVGEEPAAMAEIRHLEWLRLAAVEDLARLRLALGEHEELIPELPARRREAPYNEQLWASLMIALGRCGKRAEALIAFQHAGDALRAELDIEPGPELREIAQRLRAGVSPDPRGGPSGNRNHRRVRTLVRDARH